MVIAAVSKTAKAYGSDPYNVGSNPTSPTIRTEVYDWVVKR